MKYLMLLIALSFGIAACDQKSSTDSTRDRAAAEQEGANKVENENLAKKAEAMEKDLAKRHVFYGALEGEYEGTLRVDTEAYKIKFTFARSIPPYTGNRVRQLSEIENDLNNLYFHMQVVQWHPDDNSTAVGCRVTGIKPNMDLGTLTVASSDCPNLYNVFLSEGGNNAFTNKSEKAKAVADKIKNFQLGQISYLIGSVQPSSNATKYSFSVKKLTK